MAGNGNGGAFLGFLLRTIESRPFGTDGLEVDVEMHVTFPNPDFQNQWEENLVPKLGLRVSANQATGLRLAYQDQTVDGFASFRRDQAVAQQLQDLFGQVRNEAWIGLVPERPVRPRFPATNVASWLLRLQIVPRQKRPQLIPAAVVYYRANFSARRHLAGLLVLPEPGGTMATAPRAGSSRTPRATRLGKSSPSRRRRRRSR